MTATVQCPACGKSFSVSDTLLGKTARCKQCGMDRTAFAQSRMLIVYADEGHGAGRRDNQVLMLGHALRWMETWLK